MAYDGSKLLLRDATIGGATFNPKEYVYFTADSISTVNGAGYFADAMKRGVMQGDIVFVYVGSSGPVGPWTPHLCYFSTAPYTASGYDATTSFVTTGA